MDKKTQRKKKGKIHGNFKTKKEKWTLRKRIRKMMMEILR